jgi:hypothetical protein
MQHGRSVLQPLASLSRKWAAAMMHCTGADRDLTKLRRLDRGEACLASSLRCICLEVLASFLLLV